MKYLSCISSFLAGQRLLLLMCLFSLFATEGWGTDIVLTATTLGVPTDGSYASSTSTKDIGGVTFSYDKLMQNNSTDKYIQAQATNGKLWNSKLVPGKITQVVIEQKNNTKSSTIYWGTSADPTSNSSSFSTQGTNTMTPPANNCFGYFCIKRGSNAAYWSSVVVTYTPATITLSESSITGLDYTLGSGPSASQTFTVSGSNIPANLTVTAPTNFEVSLDGSNWGTSKTISVTLTSSTTAGTLSSTTVYVRLASGKSAGNYNGNVSIAMVGCNTISGVNPKNVAVSGTVSAVSCSDPTGLGNSSVSATGAILSVTSSSANYDLYYSTSSTAPTSGTSATATISSGTSKAITGLSYGTTYYYWARQDCGGGAKSDWVAGSPTTFTTTVPAPTGLSAGSLSMTGATISITDANNVNSYDVYCSESSTAPEAGTTPSASGSSKSIAVTGLTAGRTYYYWARAKGPNAKSTWYGGSTFTTLTLSSISVATAPTKVKYLVDDNFDPTGLVITRTYSNSTSDTYTYSGHTAEFSFSPATNAALTALNTSVTITYGGQTADQAINVYTVTVNEVNMSGTAISNASVTASCSGRTLSQSVSATNYKFNSWNVTAGGVTVSDNTITGTPSGNVTIDAKFHDPIHVTWKVDNGAASGGTTEVKYETKVTALPSTPADNTLNNCANKFMGWSTTNIGTTPVTDADDITDLHLFNAAGLSPDLTQDTTFYAVFAERQGAAENTVLWSEKFTGYSGGDKPTAPNTGVRYEAVVYGGANIGYGWTEGKDIYGEQDTDTRIMNESHTTGEAPEVIVGKGYSPGTYTVLRIPTAGATELTLTYKQNANYLKVTAEGTGVTTTFQYNSSAGTYTMDIPCVSNNTFDLSFTSNTSKNVRLDDIEVKVKTPTYSNYVTQCASEQVRVTYNANGGSAPSCAGGVTTKSASYTICTTEPTKTGYDFNKWNDGLNNYSAGATYDLQSNTTFTAQWTPTTYNITYENMEGATNALANVATYTIETSTITLGTPTRGHDRFEGWFTDDGVWSDEVTSIPLGSHGDITLYAKWTERHHIEFFKEGVSLGEMWRASDENLEDAVAGQGSVPSDPAAPTACSSKTFVGWITNDDYDSDNKPAGLMKPAAGSVDADKEYHAVWATSTSGSKTLVMEITRADFDASYHDGATQDHSSIAVANDGSGATLSVDWKSVNVGDFSSKIQIKNASGAGFWNTTDLGSISSVSITSGTDVAHYENTSAHPTSTSGTTKGYFTVTKDGSNTGKATKATITFTKTISYYTAYATSCCTKYDITGASTSGTAVEVNGKTSGTLTSSHNSRCAGKNVTLSAAVNTGYQFNGWTITGSTSGDDLTSLLDDATSLTPAAFAMPSEGITVEADITEQVVTAWSWTEHVGGGAVSDPLVVYVGQKVQLDVSYTPSTIINAHKSYTRTHGNGDNTYITTTIAQNYCTVKGNRATAAETLTLQHSDDPSGNFVKVVNVEVRALPKDKFLDLVHGVAFDDQSATLTNSDYDVDFTYTAPGGDQSEWSSSYANTCEQKKVKLVGWVESEYADACIEADSFPTTDALKADSEHFFAVGADMTAANKTYYAVWAEKE